VRARAAVGMRLSEVMKEAVDLAVHLRDLAVHNRQCPLSCILRRD
jgi:hypothetical protein